MNTVTEMIEAAHRGDRQAAADLLPVVYDELRRLAAAMLAAEPAGQTLTPTALVHEAYLKLLGGQAFDGRRHFFGAAAEALRRLLVDAARRKRAARRGGGRQPERIDGDGIAAPAPDDDLIALDDALGRFAEIHPEKAELVKLRYFAGLTADEAAVALGVSPSAGDRHWAYARAWLRRAMGDTG